MTPPEACEWSDTVQGNLHRVVAPTVEGVRNALR